ncbi:phenylacetate--CoA ligase family protein [Chloroflexota bacterium]
MNRQLSPEELASLYDESHEKMPPLEREGWLGHRLGKQVQFAYEKAPAVKEKFDKASVSPPEISSVRDLEKLPVTTKDELVELQRASPPFGGFLAAPLGEQTRIYVSPGPIYDVWPLERLYSTVRSLLRAGWPKPGDVVLVSTAYHMVPAGLCYTDALDLMGCSVVPAGPGQTELQIKLLHDLKATAIFAFPSFVMSLLQKAGNMGYDVRKDFNLKFVGGGGERHIQALRKVFKEQYGLEVFDGYGTSDLGGVGYGCEAEMGYHYADDDCVVEIVDPDTGKQVRPLEVGEVVVTPFSDVYPLVRFGTGDLGSFTDEPCPCGRTAPRITNILGMVGDHIRVKGMFVHLRELDEALSRFPQVSRYQMVLWLEGHRDRITLNIEADPDADEALLSEEINKVCQEVFKLRMDRIEFLVKGTLPDDYKRFEDTRWG